MDSKVAIIVVTYNRLKLLQEEIESLRKQTYHNTQIVVVNNGSTDDTLVWLEKQTDIITITQSNIGGAGGFYTGMKYAAENRYDYVWIMDDDVECQSDSLEQLMNVVDKIPDLGFLCSRVFAIDKETLMNVPDIDDKKRNGAYPIWLERIDEKLIRVKAATFVSVLVPVQRIYDLGLPIKEYFIWGDDMEYTNRISQKYNCYLVCDSIVVHKRVMAQSINFMTEKDPKRIRNYYYNLRNSLINEIKYGKAKDVFIKVCYLLSVFFKSLLHLDLRRVSVVMRAFFAALSFHPQIEFPKIGI